MTRGVLNELWSKITSVFVTKLQMQAGLSGKQDALAFNTTPSSSNKVATMADVPITSIEAPVNETDATLPVTALSCEVGVYYRLDVAVETLAVTLPAMIDLTTVRTVVVYLTGGTTPAVTISGTAPVVGAAPDVVYQDGYGIEAGNTYEINCLWNGLAWVVAGVKIETSNS